jgi:carbonic anhydrase
MISLDNETRKLITPQKALELLKQGNERFVNNLKINRNLLNQMNETSEGQFPFAIILSCIDSRTSAELIFDQGLGDIFSCRIAGNVINDDIIGSMEFACKVAGAKLIMVLGHTKCGAIKGACDNVKMGSLSGLLKKIKPAIKLEKDTKKADRNSQNNEFVENVANLNVGVTMKQISKKSRILRNMLKKGEITIAGGTYDVGTGKVNFLGDC